MCDIGQKIHSVAERTEKPSLRGPVGDGEDNVGEGTTEFSFKGIPEICCRAVGIILKSATAPCSKHKRIITVCPGDSEDPVNPALQEIA